MSALVHRGEGADQPGETLEQAEQHRRYAGVVEQLRPEEKRLLHLRSSGLSYDQLARVFAVPKGTIKSRLHFLVRRVQAGLDEPWGRSRVYGA